MQRDSSYEATCKVILDAPAHPLRRLIAVAGPPGSGKSTFCDTLAATLERRGARVAVVPMDGFHLDNRLLDADGSRSAKGSPHTFDAGGVLRLVKAMQTPGDIVYPLFDRSRDIALAGAGRFRSDCNTVLIEGNYLLFDAPVWRELSQHWTVSIALTPPHALLRERLVQRWLDHGMSYNDATSRAEKNDMKNADLVLDHMLPADLILSEVPT